MNPCGVCHIHVAPADPRKVIKDGVTYHAQCLKPHKRIKASQPVQLKLPLWDQCGLWTIQ